MYYWYIEGHAGLSLAESQADNVQDFNTLAEGETWIREQLCALLLGNPIDPELQREIGSRGSYRRQWLLEQAKRELLNES